MWCMKCQNELYECTCNDLKERIDKLSNSGGFAMKWCKKCDNHYAVCKCEKPEWIVKMGGNAK